MTVPTKTQLDALDRLAKGQAWDGVRSRMGGAIRRMFDRMVGYGWITGPPFELTDAGREVQAKRSFRGPI